MPGFSLFSNQKATMVVQGVGSDGSVQPFVGAVSGTSDNIAVVTAQPNPGFPDQLGIIAQGAGTANVTVSGLNAEGTPISTVFPFTITAAPTNPAVGFTATLINISLK